MKDFMLRNDTKLLFRNDPAEALKELINGRRVLFVYGGGSALKNGCLDDVKNAVSMAKGSLYEFGNASRELSDIEKGIGIAKEKEIELVIGAGGASIMDCAKLIAFGTVHTEDLWDYVKGTKNPYGLEKLPLILMPTYPSSGSEYGLGAVSADNRTKDFGTAYGIAADAAILAPKYSMSLNSEMTAYTGLVTLVQLSASTIGDKNPVSYDMGISVIRNVLKAVKKLKDDPNDSDARGVILYGASISTSGRLGLGKEENYPYEIYELEFIPEVLFGTEYRKSLTTIFPQFLKVMAKYHKEDISEFLSDAFDFSGDIDGSIEQLTYLFEHLGVSMKFDGKIDEDALKNIPIETSLKQGDVVSIIENCLKK
ncbi:MAG: iron-containing alcohol dehydrogenase [Oscillospiraceae bacterium]|nr:iron-containing alcohol dehydrogenase [Oscillospiraceae bacterium]